MSLYTDMIKFDEESMKRIDRVITQYPLSLHTCAELLEILGPVAMKLSPWGVVNWLKSKAEERLN